MISGSVTSWQIDEEKIQTLAGFIFSGSKTTAAMTNRDSMLKSRDITLQTKVPIIKAMVYPVVLYGWDNWT